MARSGILDCGKLEEGLCALPICQYEFTDTPELTFTERIRVVCERECPMYDKNWACLPAAGTVEALVLLFPLRERRLTRRPLPSPG